MTTDTRRSVLRDALTICVCTRNRPAEIERCLASLASSSIPPVAVVVSDDGTDDRTRRLVAASFPDVLYLRGPKRGIGANRNNAARAVRTDRMMFLDDDDLLAPNFLEIVDRYLVASRDVDHLIVSGVEMNHGELIVPRNFTFLGFQLREYPTTSGLETYVNTATVLPTSVLDVISFDERFVYGSEDTDFSLRATKHGYRIELLLDAVNVHDSSQINRDFYRSYKDASRIYASLKRYFTIERRPLAGLAYAVIAPLHFAASRIKSDGITALPNVVENIGRAFGYFIDRMIRAER